MRIEGVRLLIDTVKTSVGTFGLAARRALFLEDGVYVKRRAFSRTVINVVPRMPRLPHQRDNGFLPPVKVPAREGTET